MEILEAFDLTGCPIGAENAIRGLRPVLAEDVEHDNAHRPHRSLSQRPPADSDATPPTIGDVDAARLRRADRLGGLIHEHRMVA
jgi:putative transposase